MTVRDYTHAVRPLFLENESKQFTYSRCGSCTLVTHCGRFYCITAAHTLATFEHHQALIPYFPGSEVFLPIRESITVLSTENDDTDHKDVVVFEVWQDRLDSSLWRPELAMSLGRSHERPAPRKYVFAGYPTELNTPDYDRSVLRVQAFIASGTSAGASGFLNIDRVGFDPVAGLTSFDGMSGGGAFSIDQTNSHIQFEGIILRATVESLTGYILRTDALRDYVERANEGEP